MTPTSIAMTYIAVETLWNRTWRLDFGGRLSRFGKDAEMSEDVSKDLFSEEEKLKSALKSKASISLLRALKN